LDIRLRGIHLEVATHLIECSWASSLDAPQGTAANGTGSRVCLSGDEDPDQRLRNQAATSLYDKGTARQFAQPIYHSLGNPTSPMTYNFILCNDVMPSMNLA
jgi:hypothetical protein